MRVLYFHHNVTRKYYGGIWSVAFLFTLILYAVAIIVPFFLAYGSRDFWLKTNSYREKPIISATYDVITVLEGERILDDGSIEALKLIHTTLPSRIQQLFEEKTRAALIKSYTVDQNKDHFTDAIQLQVVAPLQNDEKILSVTTLVLLNVTLQDHVKMNMDAMAFHSFHSPVPGFSLFIDGDLQLKQRFPFQVKDSTQKPYAKSPLLNISNVHSIEDLSFQKIISKYRSRDHLLHFDAQYPVWRSDSLQRVASRGQRQFNLDLTIRIPSVEVLYYPIWSEVLKVAWIQYYCLFVIISSVVTYLLNYFFKTQLLEATTAIDDRQVHFKRD